MAPVARPNRPRLTLVGWAGRCVGVDCGQREHFVPLCTRACRTGGNEVAAEGLRVRMLVRAGKGGGDEMLKDRSVALQVTFALLKAPHQH